MGESSNQIERHIQETRNDLSDNFMELEEKVKTAVDWRAQFDERPGTLMGLAFGGGVLLSAVLPSLGSSRGRSSEHRWSGSPDRDAERLAKKSRTASDDMANHTTETWDALKGALVGVALAKLSGFIEELLPGFKQEFTKRQSSKGFDRSDSSAFGQPNWQKSSAAGPD